MAANPGGGQLPSKVVIADRDALPSIAAEWLAGAIRDAIAARGRCSVALAGGETPEPIYRALASPSFRTTIDWSRVDVYFSDERAVRPDQPESNYRMAVETLLSRVPVPKQQIHRLEGERVDLEAAALDYERTLPARLDVVLLGIGEDGHTASLFPGAPSLAERVRAVIPVEGPKPPSKRLTLTPKAIEAARTPVVIAIGGRKAPMVASALEAEGSVDAVPARLARRGVWFLDREAASQLTTARIVG